VTRRSISLLALLCSPLLMAAATYDPPVTPTWPGLNSSNANAPGVDIQELVRDANGGNPAAQFKLG